MDIADEFQAVTFDTLISEAIGIDDKDLVALASADPQAKARNGAWQPIALDGLDVLLRRTITALLMHEAERPRFVRSLTERQAALQGWPSARLANLSRLLLWALLADEFHWEMTFPPLIGPDQDSCFLDRRLEREAVRLSDPRPIKDLLESLRQARSASRERRADIEQREEDWQSGRSSTADDHPALPADQLLRELLRLDAATLVRRSPLSLDLSDRRTRTQGMRCELHRLILEAFSTFETLIGEQIETVRLKTDGDARHAGFPDARSANLTLLFAAALYHGARYTVLVLPPLIGFADNLREAAVSLGCGKNAPALGTGCETRVARLVDLCGREYVHTGRHSARGLAVKLWFDEAGLATSAGDI